MTPAGPTAVAAPRTTTAPCASPGHSGPVPTAPPPGSLPSLLDLLHERARTGSGRWVLHRPGAEPDVLTSRQTVASASAVAQGLLGLGVRSGARVVLVLPDAGRFIPAFFGAMMAGTVPTPAPSHAHVHRRHHDRLLSILGHGGDAVVVTEARHAGRLADLCPASVQVLAFEDLVASGTGDASLPSPQEVAYLQYTSGSVASPAPVALRHEHVLAQLAQAAEAYQETSASVSVTWVPLHHDMGLVVSVLRPLWSGYTSVIADPFDFLRDCAVWPELLTRWRATHTSAPDSGYALCAGRARRSPDLDLSALQVARTAGEPVRESTLRAFSARYAPYGLAPSALSPSYGLAEATLTVTAMPLGRLPSVRRLSRAALAADQAVPAGEHEPAMAVVSCGLPLPGTQVCVLDPEGGSVLPDGRIGEVWIAGPQVSPTAGGAYAVDGRPGHRTGDLGFLQDGELHLLGRAADRFQVLGENHYSSDLEALVEPVDERIRAGRVAVLPALLPGWKQEGVTVVAELRQEGDATSGIAERVARGLAVASGLRPRLVCLVPAGSLPLTTSGKVRRARTRELLEDGTLTGAALQLRGES